VELGYVRMVACVLCWLGGLVAASAVAASPLAVPYTLAMATEKVEKDGHSICTPEAVATHLAFFMGQASLLNELGPVVADRTGVLWRVVGAMLIAVLDSAGSFATLVGAGKARDCYVLARTLFETILTTAFILAGGEPVAEKAVRHAKQKAYRDLDRESRVAGQVLRMRWRGSVNLDEDPDLKSAVAEYTGKKGQELREWTPENVVQQIECVGRKYGPGVVTPLQGALSTVLRHGSEVVHGTYFGSLYPLGCTLPGGPPTDQAGLIRRRCEQVAMLALVMGWNLETLLAILAKELDLPEIRQRASVLWESVRAQRAPRAAEECATGEQGVYEVVSWRERRDP
jgi:hypothetical protein